MHTNKTSCPMALLYIDHFRALLKTKDGNEFILNCRDNFTRYVWLIAVKDTNAETVAKALETRIFKY